MKVFFQLFVLIYALLLLPSCVSYNCEKGIEAFRAQHYRDAFIYLKPLAEKGQADAQYAIGWMFYYGQGVTEDRRRALIWISRAASAGQADAVTALETLTRTPVPVRLSSQPPIMEEL